MQTNKKSEEVTELELLPHTAKKTHEAVLAVNDKRLIVPVVGCRYAELKWEQFL